MPKTVRVRTVEERESGVAAGARPAPGTSQPHPEVAPAPLPAVESVAIVGNGPSAAGQGRLIDSHEFVVRCNDWRAAFPKFEAGAKCNAVCVYPPEVANCRWRPAADVEIWLSTPTRPSFWRDPAGAPFRWVSSKTYYRMHEMLKALHKPNANSRACWPSTGLVGLTVALGMKAPKVLVVGFDATVKAAPGWGDYSDVKPWSDIQGHDYVAEKKIIAMLLEEYGGETVWLRS